MRYLYSFLLYVLSPLACLYLKKRGKKNPAYNQDWNQRFGFNLKQPINKPIIWFHAVSVGETRAIAKLIELIEQKYPSYQILITHMTPTGKATAKSLYPNAILQYVPYDLPHAVISFYKMFKPKIGMIVETEIWPNLIHYAKRYNIPLFLINARLSNKSYNSYNKIKYLIRPILNQFSAILCQDELTKNNFTKLGCVNDLRIIGSTKFDLIINDKQVSLGGKLKEQINKKIIVFASSRDGEEKLLLNYLKDSEYLFIIIPRHIERFSVVEDLLKENDITYIKRSDNQVMTENVNVVLGDSIGEMFFYYALSDIVIMGGSFNDFGSQNLIEPISLGKPVILGPSIFNFAEIAKNAFAANCAIQVEDMRECFKQIKLIVDSKPRYKELVNNCQLFCKNHLGASDKILDFIDNYI